MYGDKMRITCFLILFLIVSGCERIRHSDIENNYSGFTLYNQEKASFKNTSLCKTTDDVLYCKPCAIRTIVSEDFMRGYNDVMISKKIKLFGKNDDYQTGNNLGLNDKKDNVSRKFDVRK